MYLKHVNRIKYNNNIIFVKTVSFSLYLTINQLNNYFIINILNTNKINMCIYFTL